MKKIENVLNLFLDILTVILTFIMILAIIFLIGWLVFDTSKESAVNIMPEVTRANLILLIKEEPDAKLVKEEQVLFTVFKDENLGTGIDKSTLDVNEEGMYLYQDRVVIATATHECVYSDVGACAMINGFPIDYHIFNYYDELFIQVNDKIYPAIVLDSCGACSVDCNEPYQRVDILVTDDTASMLVEGNIIYAY